MSIKQLNVQYFMNEDRILLRMNTLDNSEYKFWLTRRITHYILQSVAKFTEKEFEQKPPSVEGVISESKQSSQPNQQATFGGSYESGTQYPIGADPLLVIDAKCVVIKNGDQDIFSLDFILPGGGSVNLKLTMPIMKKVIHLVEEANTQANWGL